MPKRTRSQSAISEIKDSHGESTAETTAGRGRGRGRPKKAPLSADVTLPPLPSEQPPKPDTEELNKQEEESSVAVAPAASVAVVGSSSGVAGQPWTFLVHRKAQAGWQAYDPSTMRKSVDGGHEKEVFKLLSWNVNGLRALVKLKGKGPAMDTSHLTSLVDREKPHVLCLQETKLQTKDVDAIKKSLLPEYSHSFWSCSTAKLGYSGCALFSKVKPLRVKYGLGVEQHDMEGRVITAEFEKLFVVTVYVPNSGEKLDRLGYREKEWDPALSRHIKDLEASKPVIMTGDLNVAHCEIDIYHPDGNRKSAGFTQTERDSFERVYLDEGFVDTFRRQHPNAVAYTYWGYRTAARPKNAGWRLDYVLLSASLASAEYDSFTVPDVGGSDHCPVGITIAI